MSTPAPISPMQASGMNGVCRLFTAITAARTNPMLPPAIGRTRLADPFASTLEANRRKRDDSHTAAKTPTKPPATAPANKPVFPWLLPMTDPANMQMPLRMQTRTKIRTSLYDTATVVSRQVSAKKDCGWKSITARLFGQLPAELAGVGLGIRELSDSNSH